MKGSSVQWYSMEMSSALYKHTMIAVPAECTTRICDGRRPENNSKDEDKHWHRHNTPVRIPPHHSALSRSRLVNAKGTSKITLNRSDNGYRSARSPIVETSTEAD